MGETERSNREFVGYEYKELAEDQRNRSFLIDGYGNFGWELDENPLHEKKTVQLKRNRKIMNKMELTRLQRNFESCIGEIEKLEQAKTTMASAVALIIGMIGTAFMAGVVFAINAEPPHIILCAFLAAPAFAGWIAPYFVYRQIAARQTERMNPLIEEKYEEIYEICERGNRLLNGSALKKDAQAAGMR